VVGASGSRKTTLSRVLAEGIHAPLIELDALMHQPGWVPRSDGDFQREVDQATHKAPGWLMATTGMLLSTVPSGGAPTQWCGWAYPDEP